MVGAGLSFLAQIKSASNFPVKQKSWFNDRRDLREIEGWKI